MQTDDNDTFYPAGRREALGTLAVTGLTIALLALAGYFAPTLLAAAIR